MKYSYFLYAACALGLLAILYARYELFLYFEAQETIAHYAGQTGVVEGVVADDPDKRGGSLHVVIAVEQVNGEPASGKLLALLPRETALSYGDKVEVRGGIGLPEAFETNAGRMFDYLGYLRVRGISVVINRAALRSYETGPRSLRGMLFSLKHWFEHSLEQSLPEPQASLLEGILLGERGGFPQDLLQMFVVAGLIHIVVLSGSNVAIVSEAVFRTLGAAPFIPRKLVYVLGAGAIALFVVMTGAGAATVRGGLMGGVAILARYMRRPAAALRALAAAALLMALWNPLVVFYDNGFILSVLATFGLITLAAAIERKLTLLPAWERFNIRSIVATTLAVEIFILPALLYLSGTLSFISIPINVLVLPSIPLIMLLGFLAGVLGLIHPLLAFTPALAADFLLRFVIGVTEAAAALPFAATLVAPFPAWIAVAVYVPLTWLALRIYARAPTN